MPRLAFLTAMLCGLLFSAVAHAQPVETHSESGCGFTAYSTTTTDSVPLANGHTLVNFHDWGLFYTDDPASILNESRYDCFGSHPFDAAGVNLGGQGYCAGIAKDGDHWWIHWTGTQKGGDWHFSGGTGKFADIPGGGEWSNAAGFAPQETITVWHGQWQWRE